MNNSDSDSSNTGFHFIQEFEIPPEGLDLDLIPTSPELDDSIDGNSITEIGSIDTDSELELNSSERSNSPLNVSSPSSINSTLFGSYTGGLNDNSFYTTTPKTTPNRNNNWCIPKELYNREIGHYKNSTLWSTKFCQSLVAVQKLKLSQQLKGHLDGVNSLNFNRAGNLIASGSDDCRISLWNWSEGKQILFYNSKHISCVLQTKFLPQGDMFIVSSGQDGFVTLTSINNSAVAYSKIIAKHSGPCSKLGIHCDTPNVILSCGDDGVIKNIDLRESPSEENKKSSNILYVRNRCGTNSFVFGLDINPLKPFEFIVNADDEYVRMYDKRRLTSGTLKTFRRKRLVSNPSKITNGDDENENIEYQPFPASVITSAVYSYCGTEILASYSDDDVYLFDVNCAPNTYKHSYSGHLNHMSGVNFYGPRSDYVVSGSICGHLFIWDKKTEAIVQKKRANALGAVNVLEPHPHSFSLATSGFDNTIKIWEPLNDWKQPNIKRLQKVIVTNRALIHQPLKHYFNNLSST